MHDTMIGGLTQDKRSTSYAEVIVELCKIDKEFSVFDDINLNKVRDGPSKDQYAEPNLKPTRSNPNTQKM